jgi:uncharacterized damage-inducible protein DinB
MTVDRQNPPLIGDERSTLNGFLDYYRATLAVKCDGLTPEQLAARTVEPSSVSLLGLVRHMAEVERGWFRGFNGEDSHPRYYSKDDPDGDFDNVAGEQAQVDDAFAFWQAEIEHAREIVAAAHLDATYVRARENRTFSLRWILVHMIEEYARHAGHADFLRERIDGAVGD